MHDDLAGDRHDEALTLSTAFLAAGAATVVGARWEIPDETSALLRVPLTDVSPAANETPFV